MKTRLRGRLIVPATLAVTVIACSSTPTHDNNGGSNSGTGAGSTSSHGTGAGSTTSAGTGAGSTSGTGAGSTSGMGGGSTGGTGAGATGGFGGGFTSGPGVTVGPTSTGAGVGGGEPCQPVPIADAGVLTYECADGRMCGPPDPSMIDGGVYQVCPGYMECATLVSYDGGAMLGYC